MIKKFITKAVFPAAGLGTRFLPATKASPKEMLPIVDIPQIEYAVEEALGSGVEDFIIITGKNKRAIEDHFDYAYELEDTLNSKGKKELLKQVNRFSEHSFAYIRQGRPLGLGHAVLCARPFVQDEPFAVLLSDDIIDPDESLLKLMVKYYAEKQSPVLALMEVPPQEVDKYGIVRAEAIGDDLFRITDLVEKPSPKDAPSNLAVIGRYILTPDIFEHLQNLAPGAGGEIQLTDGIKSLLSKRPVFGCLFRGKRYDAGDKLGFLKATTELALKNPVLKDSFRNYLIELTSRL